MSDDKPVFSQIQRINYYKLLYHIIYYVYVTMDISNSISPPSYELKTSDKGWFMQIGFRDSLAVHQFEEPMNGPCIRSNHMFDASIIDYY